MLCASLLHLRHSDTVRLDLHLVYLLTVSRDKLTVLKMSTDGRQMRIEDPTMTTALWLTALWAVGGKN